ncbi:MAG TPA: TetR family transcriptional regulator [Burkholderiaceae bacterium]|nr:TetR family transcriptional regulator [Burkholderiaceae bacterium]
MLIAAERLFARDGTTGVSLRAIAREAGQRNTGAVHYYFGSREGVIEAIFEFRAAGIDKARTEALDAIPSHLRGSERVRAVVAAIVVPFAEQAEASSMESHYPRFVAQLIQSEDEIAHRIWRARFSGSIESAYARLAEALPQVPAAVLQHRFATLFRLAVYATADLDRGFERSRPPAGHDAQRRLQIENVIDMLAAAVAAPLSEALRDAATKGSLARPTRPGSLSRVFRRPNGNSGES